MTALLILGLGSAGCTLVKPVVGAVTGPIYGLAVIGDGGHCGGCHDGYGYCFYFAGAAVVGATAGLVTGIISDVQVLRGRTDDPTRNWFNPFDTNTPSEW